jgi:hypothetical protein
MNLIELKRSLGQLRLGGIAAMLDRLLYHGHVLKCGPRSWRTKMDLPDQEAKR